MCVCGGCREIEEWSKDVYLSTEYPWVEVGSVPQWCIILISYNCVHISCSVAVLNCNKYNSITKLSHHLDFLLEPRNPQLIKIPPD